MGFRPKAQGLRGASYPGSRTFDAAYEAIGEVEVDLKIARGNLRLAQAEATALLMAYGHGVRARFGDED